MTCFLRELILYANTTPFRHNASWLPDIEKDIYALHQQSPFEYMLLAEVVSFVQKLVVFSSDETYAIDNAALIEHIQNHQLYSPENDFIVYKDHAVLSEVYSLVCQSICMLHLTTHQLNENLPALAHYYDLPADINGRSEKILRMTLVLILSINQHMEQPDLNISKRCVTHHLKQIKNWRKYSQQQFKSWLAYPHGNRQVFYTLLNVYIMAASVHALSTVKIKYYQWIYDVLEIYWTPKLITA